MKKNRLARTQTDRSLCVKCNQQQTVEIPLVRHVILLSVLPWIAAIILAIIASFFFLLFIPIIGILNMKLAKRKPLRRCSSCHFLFSYQP